MRQHVAKLSPALFLVGGCSLIYNPSNIEKPPVDGQSADAAIDAAPIFDADPTMIAVDDVVPTTLLEGQGIDGSRAAILVIHGHHFVPDGIDVQITPSDGLTIGTPMVSQYGDYIAVPVTVALDMTKSTEMVDLTVTVNETGAPTPVMLADKLKLRYLPELTTGTTIDSTVEPLYSQVMLGDVTATGTAPVIVRAVSSITIGAITANGGDGAKGTNVGAAGPGGCAGGGAGMTGGCSGFDGGGGGTTSSGGGGGGGFGADGAAGNGGGGTKGATHGNDQVVNLLAGPASTNRSGGGGGGGGGTLAGAGAGGGGGGTVVLLAGGNITTGAISANGGAGGAGQNGLGTGAGGGGGGSGGLVVARSDAGALSVASISAVGGGGGTGGNGLGGNGGAGGTGGVGRIRLDAPGSIPASSSPQAHRGPSFDAATATISTVANPTLTLAGTNDDQLDGYVIDAAGMQHFGEPMDQKLVNGILTVTPTLLPGYNKLCFTSEPGTRGDELADTCIEIAYLP